jgi:hypothetical protein
MRAQKANEEALSAKREEDRRKCRKKKEENKRKREAEVDRQRQDMKAVIEEEGQKLVEWMKIYQAAMTIQNAWKAYFLFLTYQRTLTDIHIVQCVFRCRSIRREQSAMTIPATWRGYCGRLAYQSLAVTKSLELSKDPENSVDPVNGVIFTLVKTERLSTKIDVFKSAELVWKSRYGYNLPKNMTTEINEGCGGKQLWIYCMMFKDSAGRKQTLSTKKEGFPSAFDDFMVDLPDGEGVAFTKKKITRAALYWKIICNTPLKGDKLDWVKDIDTGQSRNLTRGNSNLGADLWCTVYRDSDGILWIHYNKRKMSLLH